MSWPWSELGLPGPSDLSAVRHAYAQRLKTAHPEEDPEGFQRLHSAFQTASRLARREGKRASGQTGASRPERPGPAPEQREDAQPREGSSPKWDYEQLLKESQDRPRRREEPPPEWDYEQLLKEGQGRPRRREEPPPEWDYEQLLQEGQSSRSRQHRPPPEWDYEQLLKGDQSGASGPGRQEEQDWDYERLFAEGDAERAQARRRRGQERSQRARARRSSYQRERHETFARQQAQWRATETMLHTLELLYTSGAPAGEWTKLFQSGLFQQAKGSLDLIFGLEDFLSTHPDLPQPVRFSLFLAFGFQRGVPRPELQPLYQMLLPARREEEKKKHRRWGLNLLGFFGGITALFLFAVVLTSSLLPLYLLLGWFACYGVKKGWLTRPPQGLGQHKRRWLLIFVLILAAVGLGLGFPLLSQRLDPPDPRELVCQYLEEDFGRPVLSLYSEDAEDAQRYSNVFRDTQSSLLFLAGPGGERDPEAGQRGYTTNYTDMQLMASLRQFTRNQETSVILSMDEGADLERWETSGRYLLRLPYCGAEEVIRQLGAWLEETARADWYQELPPSFHLTLVSDGMAEGEYLRIAEYDSDSGPFDAQSVLDYYTQEFSFHYCAALIKACGLGQSVLSNGVPIAHFAAQGEMEAEGQSFYWLAGLDEGHDVVIQYFVSSSGGSIRCFPDALIHTEEELLDLPFYKLVHLSKSSGPRFQFVDIYYPFLR